MNKISKTISLEDSKSRLPGMITSLVNDKFINIDNIYMKTNYNGNYGLIVSDIEIPNRFVYSITDNTDILINIPNGNDFYLIYPNKDSAPTIGIVYYIEDGNIYKNGQLVKYLTYFTLIKWYNFFIYYNDILCVENCDYKRKYNSAIEYYESEISYKDDNLYEYYNSLDKLYTARGGSDFYNWICSNCIIKYEIPIDYQDAWNRSYLYYPEVIKWKSWFTIRYNKYKDLNIDKCDSLTDCKEYFIRGGNAMYNSLKNFNINKNNDSATKSASINIPINIVTTIDDMGELSIFCNEWVGGENYDANNIGGAFSVAAEQKIGPIVTHDNIVYGLKNEGNNSGFTYDDKYKEIVFPKEQWINYYDYYKEKYGSEFKPSFSTYTYDNNEKFIGNPTPEDLKEEYTINVKDIYVINDTIYNVIISDYIIFNGSFYVVQKYENGLPYVYINAKKYVALFIDGEYKFILGYKACAPNSKAIIIKKNGVFIYYDGGYFQVKNNTVTIDNTTYPMLNGYTTINNLNYYISGGSLVSLYGAVGDDNILMTYTEDKTFGSKINGNIDEKTKGYLIVGNKIMIYYPYTIYYANIVNGVTTSKLEVLKEIKKATDDIGNDLPGFFVLNQKSNGTKYAQPKENDLLDLYYKVGNTSDLTKVYNGDNEVVFGEFFGNILTNIKFYYCNSKGEIILDTLIELSLSSSTTTNLEAIKQCDVKKDELFHSTELLFEENITCEIEYYIGSFIKQNVTGSTTSGYSFNGYTFNKDSGIKYTDTVKLIKKQCDYYITETINYPLYYYEMNYPLSTTILNEYSNTTTVNKNCKFSYTINENNNGGYIASPNVRLEYKFGSSSLQKVESNVYIDRGISNALDKHLKLGEVGSFESLSQYANGQFNIINNN